MLHGRRVMSARRERKITIASDTLDINLRTLHDSLFPVPRTGDVVRFFILAGVVIGSTSTATPALETGSWPAGVFLEVHNEGRVAGKSGAGGNGGSCSGFDALIGTDGQAGGPALKATASIKFNNISGVVASGGGGGGGGGAGVSASVDFILHGAGGGGASGAGRTTSSPGTGGSPNGSGGGTGTLTAGAAGGAGGFQDGTPVGLQDAIGGKGGDSGGPGQAGQSGESGSGSTDATAGRPGGAAGKAIDGIGNITFIDAAGAPTADQGSILGPTS